MIQLNVIKTKSEANNSVLSQTNRSNILKKEKKKKKKIKKHILKHPRN
jgi:hypothetical protein